jgi:hypothetical protein
MNKKNKPFFGTNISEDDMKDSGLFITENTKPIGLSTWEQVKLETNWDQKEKEWNKWMFEFQIRNQKSIKRASVVGALVSLLGTVSAYTSSVWAFESLDSSYADSANVYIGLSAVGFALVAGIGLGLAVKSVLDWFEAKKKLKELNS